MSDDAARFMRLALGLIIMTALIWILAISLIAEALS